MESFVIQGKAKTVFRLIEMLARAERQEKESKKNGK